MMCQMMMDGNEFPVQGNGRNALSLVALPEGWSGQGDAGCRTGEGKGAQGSVHVAKLGRACLVGWTEDARQEADSGLVRAQVGNCLEIPVFHLEFCDER